MYNRLCVGSLLVLSFCFLSCAGGSGGGPSMQFKYSANVGQGTGAVSLAGFRDITYRVLEGRFQYHILRFRELGSRITYETDWQNRAAFADEFALGAEEAKTKIIGDAKYMRLSADGASTKITHLRLTAENMLLNAGVWELKPCTKECSEYLRNVFDKLENEIISKMRSF